MQLYNANASFNAPLQFPEGIIPPFALSKVDLLTLSGKFKVQTINKMFTAYYSCRLQRSNCCT